jgi:hypothetical protein
MTSRPLPTVSAVLFALAAVIDIAFLAVIGHKDAAPLGVELMFAAFGVITLAALIPARRGYRSALITVIVLRVVSALLAFVSFFAGAPILIKAGETVVIVATIAALTLMRRRSSAAVTA